MVCPGKCENVINMNVGVNVGCENTCMKIYVKGVKFLGVKMSNV